MEISDINKVAYRKRLTSAAEEIREKVSREATNIIKLKVAQDTAYWDVKEKLHQLESNHEKLQQNMVAVQMQHEMLSGQYQDEMRLRPETINKVGSTRKICDVLEKYCERLKQTLSRCQADHAELRTAYKNSGQLVKELKRKSVEAEEKNKFIITNLEDKVKISCDSQKQLFELFTKSKLQAEDDIKELKSQLSKYQSQHDESNQLVNELNREVDDLRRTLEMKEQNIASLQNDLKCVIQEATNQTESLRNTLAKREQLFKDLEEGNAALKRALSNQEEFANDVVKRNNELQDKVMALEEVKTQMQNEIKELTAELQNMSAASEIRDKEVADLIYNNEQYAKEINDRNETIKEAQNEIEKSMNKIKEMEAENTMILNKLSISVEEHIAQDKIINELKSELKSNEDKIANLENALKECRITNEAKITELNDKFETAQKDVASKVETISNLMLDINKLMELRNNLEATIEQTKKENEEQRQLEKEKEAKYINQLEQLNKAVKENEKELSQQMTIILELRNEKEKLTNKVSCMQNKMDNIHEKLTEPLPRKEPQHIPEQDDNAIELSPPRNMNSSAEVLPRAPHQFAVPARAEFDPLDDLLCSFSDSSTDCGLDKPEINRRFEALLRGERLPSVPLSALKRRKHGDAHAGLKIKKQALVRDDGPLSLSQVRNQLENKENKFFKTKKAPNSRSKKST